MGIGIGSDWLIYVMSGVGWLIDCGGIEWLIVWLVDESVVDSMDLII